MAWIVRFLNLSRSDKRLLLHCLWVVIAVRIGLIFLPYQAVIGVLRERLCGGSNGPEHIAWAIAKAARLVPRASCLTQGLAAQMLLARAGHQSHLRIGVSSGGEGGFIAHAWLMSGERILLGGPSRDLAHYTTLTDLSLPQA